MAKLRDTIVLVVSGVVLYWGLLQIFHMLAIGNGMQ